MVDREETTDQTASHEQLDDIELEAPVDLTGLWEFFFIERKKKNQNTETFTGNEEGR